MNREKLGEDNILNKHGYQYSISNFDEFLADADYVIANLEAPLTPLEKSDLAGYKKYIHQGEPQQTARLLNRSNINRVSLANNHAMDYGTKGLRETISILEQYDIRYLGAGLNDPVAAMPVILDLTEESGAARVIIAAGFKYIRRYDLEYGFYAKRDSGGVNKWFEKTLVIPQ